MKTAENVKSVRTENVYYMIAEYLSVKLIVTVRIVRCASTTNAMTLDANPVTVSTVRITNA
jgi:hypothetical protein